MNRECPSVSKILDRYFDQEVTQEERAMVESHLPDCPTCRRSLESMEALRTWIKRPVELSAEKENFPWVWEKIEKEIQRQDRPNVWESLRSWLEMAFPRRKVWVPAIAGAVILVLLLTPLVLEKFPSYSKASVVEYVESETYNVMIYEGENQKVTVIWLYNGLEEELSGS